MFCNKSHAFAYLPIHLAFDGIPFSLSLGCIFFRTTFLVFSTIDFLSAFFSSISYTHPLTFIHFLFALNHFSLLIFASYFTHNIFHFYNRLYMFLHLLKCPNILQ